jgi:hypothetical protein
MRSSTADFPRALLRHLHQEQLAEKYRNDLTGARGGETGKTTPSNDIHIGGVRLVPTEMHRRARNRWPASVR